MHKYEKNHFIVYEKTHPTPYEYYCEQIDYLKEIINPTYNKDIENNSDLILKPKFIDL